MKNTSFGDFLNLTPHPVSIRLPDGPAGQQRNLTLAPSGVVARVTAVETVFAHIEGVPVAARTFGAVEGLPDEGVPCIVSALVAGAVPGRPGVFAPDTGATAIRDEQGRIVSVTRLIAA